MNRIDRYLKAIESNTLDDYYYNKEHPGAKQQHTNKGRWHKKGQGKYIRRGKHGEI